MVFIFLTFVRDHSSSMRPPRPPHSHSNLCSTSIAFINFPQTERAPPSLLFVIIASIFIDVTMPFSPSSSSFVQVSLACRATGARPPAKIQWFRNNVAFNLPEGEDQLYPLQFLSRKEHRKGTPRMTIALAIGQPERVLKAIVLER